MRPFYLFVLFVLLVSNTIAQDIVNMPDVNKRPTANATILIQEPVIDGKVVGDEVWDKLVPIDKLIQTKSLLPDASTLLTLLLRK